MEEFDELEEYIFPMGRDACLNLVDQIYSSLSVLADDIDDENHRDICRSALHDLAKLESEIMG